MARDFPYSPAEGQTFAGYIFTGGVWAKAPYQTALPFNYVVNGSMQASLEAGDTAIVPPSASGWPADMWAYGHSAGAGVTGQRVILRTPRGSNYRIRLTVNTADTAIAAGDIFYIYNTMEGFRVAPLKFGTVDAQQVVIRFGLKAPAGTYCMCLRNKEAAAYRAYDVPIVISAGQANTDTEHVFVVPGDVTGSWPATNAMCMEIFFTFATGSTYAGTAGAWQAGNFVGLTGQSNGLGVVGNVFEIFDVGLYGDPYNTGVAPPWLADDGGRAALDAARYWFKIQSCRGVSVGAAQSRAGQNFMTEMRTAPAYAKVGAVVAWDQSTSQAVNSISTPYSNQFCCEMEQVTAATMTTGRSCFNPSATDFTTYFATSAR